MENEKYKMAYKYGVKIGSYEASYGISVNFLKQIFKKDTSNKIKRIKWLSNCEMELLWNEMFDYLNYDKNRNGERNEEKLKEYEENILKLLR